MDKQKLAKTDPLSKEMTWPDFNWPQQMFTRFGRDFESLFDRLGFMNRMPLMTIEPVERMWAPDVEMFERGNELIVRADLPGLRKEDVTVEIGDNELILKGERKREKEEKQEGFYRAERTYGSFYRTIPLPEGVKLDQAKALVIDGVLEVKMPLAKIEQKRRRLEIAEPASGEKAKHAA